uniref:Uncharacterized protein n=1 Tax=Aegilops tauschii subsp. strangulata TaxID=200361 RepID=A0A453N6C5_AEGTS
MREPFVRHDRSSTELVQKGAGLGTRSSHAITLISSMAYSFGCEYAFNLKAQSWYALDLAG